MQFMLKECSGATQKGPNGSLRREQPSDREIGINAWRGGVEGLEEWGACSFKLGNPSPVPRLSLLLTLWAAKSPRPGRWGGTPFCSSPPYSPVMSWQGWGLQSQAPDCLGSSWLGPSGTHVLSALCLSFLFCSVLLCCIFIPAHQLLYALLKAPCNAPSPSHLIACLL